MYENLLQLKMPSHKDGKYYSTDCGNIETCLRIIQSIPHKNAEPVRAWLASLGAKELSNAAANRRQRVITNYERAGLGSADEVQWLKERGQRPHS